MAIWYEVEKTEEGLKTFLDCNWAFHDFRLEKVEYITKRDMVEIFLKYDTMNHGVLLRFVKIYGVGIDTERCYEVDWMQGSTIMCLENNSLIWFDDDSWSDKSRMHLDEMKKETTWVEAEKLFWAVTDADGNPVEMPQNRKHQVWNIYGTIIEKHLQLKEFAGNWDDLYQSN